MGVCDVHIVEYFVDAATKTSFSSKPAKIYFSYIFFSATWSESAVLKEEIAVAGRV